MEAKATLGMRIVPYTPKSFAVIGETYAHRVELKSMGGEHYLVVQASGYHEQAKYSGDETYNFEID